MLTNMNSGQPFPQDWSSPICRRTTVSAGLLIANLAAENVDEELFTQLTRIRRRYLPELAHVTPPLSQATRAVAWQVTGQVEMVFTVGGDDTINGHRARDRQHLPTRERVILNQRDRPGHPTITCRVGAHQIPYLRRPP